MGTTWDDICKSVDGWTKKANRKVEQMTETAAVRIKISAKKAEMDDAYLALGKLTYENTNAASELTEEGRESADLRIADKIAEIATLQADIEALEQKLNKSEEV